MRRAASLASLFLVLCAGRVGAQAVFPAGGFVSRDCLTPANVEALGGELYGNKIGAGAADVLFDAHASGGGRVVADLLADTWFFNSQWRTNAQSGHKLEVAITLPGGELVLDSANFVTSDFGTTKPQAVGSIDGVAPQVIASNFGYEVRFRALRQITPDEAVGCATAGDPAVDFRPIAGYNVYRLQGTGTPTLAQFRTSGFLAFIDLAKLKPDVADADGFHCADLSAADEARFVNPNGVTDDGDEIIAFRDTLRTPSGRQRTNAPDPRQSYVYRIQPVLLGDPFYYANGGTVGFTARPVAAADRDGNGSKESIDLLADGRYELIDPGMNGFGLTWSGEILSSPQPGRGTPGPAPADPDGDGIASADEIAAGLNPAVSNATTDTDGDGPLDRMEIESGADPMAADGDGGGERDGREMFYGRSPANPCDDIVLTRPLGDVAPAGGGNGVVDVADAVRMLRLSVLTETPTAYDITIGDVGPSELTDASTNPDTWRRHGNPDGTGQYPYGYYEHGDGALNVQDAVAILRQAVNLQRVTD